MRKLLAVCVVLTMSVGLLVGAEYGGVIKSVDGNKVTFMKGAKKGEKGAEVTMPAVTGVKVMKMKFNAETKKMEAGEALEGGLKNEMIKEGARVFIVTDADDKHITEMRVGGGKKKKE